MDPSAPICVALVEDDARLAALVTRYLESRGVRVETATDGPSGVQVGLRPHVECVLLDIMLPGFDGLEVCRRIRARSDVPIVMLTALESEGERVMGLEQGADDYVVKPFSTPELLARVRAMVRRYRGQLKPAAEVVEAGEIRLNRHTREAWLRAARLELTTHEFDLLLVMAERAGRVLSREQLLELTHADPGDAFDRSIDGHVSRLRAKLGDPPRQPRILRTIRGVGYQLNAVRGDEP